MYLSVSLNLYVYIYIYVLQHTITLYLHNRCVPSRLAEPAGPEDERRRVAHRARRLEDPGARQAARHRRLQADLCVVYVFVSIGSLCVLLFVL